MEPAAAADHHQQQQAHHPINNDQELGGGGGGKNTSSTSNSNFLCRQSSTRWTPTSEQIRILKELYYNNGVRSPTAEQIQRISAKLRQYGKIEGKNVFYWFQNHKARERQKKRFTADHHLHHHHHQFHHNHVTTMHRASTSSASASACKTNNNSEDHVMISTRFYNKFSAGSNNINHGPAPAAGNFASSSNYTPGNLLPVANYGYGSVAMEKSFRECSITPNGGGSMAGQNFAWVGVNNDPSSYTFLEKRKYTHQTLEIEDHEDQEQDPTAAAANLPEIETLPLFPMHGDDIKNQETADYFNGWHRRADDSFSAAAGGSRASLELTLNSYAARFSATSP